MRMGHGRLARGDVEAGLWPRVKMDKAKQRNPNYWEACVSSQDAAETGLGQIADWCFDSVLAAYEREGLPTDGLVVVCMVSSRVRVGKLRIEREFLNERAKEVKIASAHVALAEVRDSTARSSAVQLWNGVEIPLVKGVSIGRDPSNDIVASVAGVSRRHGQIIVRRDGTMTYLDRSKNGSMVNGARVHNRSVPIGPGSRIGLTPTTFIQIN
ncbi:MAG: FHA domain-containing protein [Coriobacteriales bacterium]|nr:FHA domain-containing protein [Coriobacteriales bacterium]